MSHSINERDEDVIQATLRLALHNCGILGHPATPVTVAAEAYLLLATQSKSTPPTLAGELHWLIMLVQFAEILINEQKTHAAEEATVVQ